MDNLLHFRPVQAKCEMDVDVALATPYCDLEEDCIITRVLVVVLFLNAVISLPPSLDILLFSRAVFVKSCNAK